jgi:acyl carrier protein
VREDNVERKEILERVVEIVRPLARNRSALAEIDESTSILDDLKVNSARLVDLILDLEDAFGVEITDDDADQVITLGDAVDLVERLLA